MKPDVRLSANNIQADAIETAREAARRSGLSLGQWLNSAILDSAAELGVRPPSRNATNSIHDQLQRIAERLDQFGQGGGSAPAPRRPSVSHDTPDTAPERLADVIARLNHRLDGSSASRPRFEQSNVQPARSYSPQPRNSEYELAELRQTLNALMQAQNVADTADTAETFHEQSQDTDQIRTDDAAIEVIQSLNSTITDGQTATNHSASSEAADILAADIRALTLKVDQLIQTVTSTDAGKGRIPANFESLIKTLTERLEAIRVSDQGQALGRLTDQITGLTRKIDTSTAKIDKLSALERGIAEIAAQIKGAQTNTAEREVGNLRHELAALHTAHVGSEQRTQNTLTSIRETLERLADRAWSPTAAQSRSEQMVSPNLTADKRIERVTGTITGRIDATPVHQPAPSITLNRPVVSAPPGKADFIAAARRASKAAHSDPYGGNPILSKHQANASVLAKFRRPIMIGMAILLAAAGAFYFTKDRLDLIATAQALTNTIRKEMSHWIADVTSVADKDSTKSIANNIPMAAPALTKSSAPPAAPVTKTAANEQNAPSNSALAFSEFERAGNLPPQLSATPSSGGTAQTIDPQKTKEATRQTYLTAAEQGDAKAMHNLATLYVEGVDGKPDYKTAAQWFRKAAERGLAESQYNLGILYSRGMGVEQNLVEAYRWFALAAKQGIRDAQEKLSDAKAPRSDSPRS